MVRLRMKRMGRRHRPFYRICAMDQRQQRDGRVIEELGTYDPMVGETDARVTLVRDRVDYWISVGAQPSEKVAVLIKKYGTGGTHLDAQATAMTQLEQHRNRYKLREVVRTDTTAKRRPAGGRPQGSNPVAPPKPGAVAAPGEANAVPQGHATPQAEGAAPPAGGEATS